MFWYGTNEADLPDLDPEALRQEYVALLSRLRASTGAECLLIGPDGPAAAGRERPVDGSASRWPGCSPRCPAVAQEAGCAYWSARAAMGGERSMLRWQRAEPVLGHRTEST